jgi:hypothetical protein
MEHGWQRIYFAAQPHLVQIAKAVLEDNHIECVVVDKRDSSYVTIGEVELYVKDGDVTLSKFLLRENNL